MPRRFRIAFSFAGEKRDFVERTAAILATRFSEKEILYDKYHTPEFSRSDLAFYLPELYEKEADLIVAVICPDYEKREWCGLEWDAIFGLLKKRKVSEVMLMRFARVEARGLHGLAGYTDLDDLTPAQAAAGILERFAFNQRHAAETPASAAPGTTPVPNNLPRLPPFFGREKELASLCAALDPGSRTWGALISGPGGMGKTALAVRVAELVPPGTFQRIFFLSAKHRTIDEKGPRDLSDFALDGWIEMVGETARRLDRADITKAPEADRPRLLCEALARTKTLLILDNLESLRDSEQQALASFVENLPRDCKALLTSRTELGFTNERLLLPELDRAAAMACLAEIAERNRQLAKATEAERLSLCAETGGNPLLLRWVAGQVGSGDRRTVGDALAFLRSCPAENDPLEYIFGDLLGGLDDDEVRVLAALAFPAQAIPTEAIAEIGGIPQDRALAALKTLANRAFVLPDQEEKFFTLVPMVANFVRRKRPEIVAETGMRLEQRAYALIVENGGEEFARFPILDAAWPTIAPALPLFLAGPNVPLQIVCGGLNRFLEFTGRWDESLSFNQQAEARAVAAKDYLEAGWRAYRAGWVHVLRRQAEPVLACAARAEKHWQSAETTVTELCAVPSLRGCGYFSKKNYADAIEAYREALTVCLSVAKESRDASSILAALAGSEKDSGDFEGAERDYREALRMAHAVDYEEGVCCYTGNLSRLALDQKNWPLAETLAREALTLSEKIGRQELIGLHRTQLAEAILRQGRAAGAEREARQAVDIFTKLHSPELEAAQRILTECEQAARAAAQKSRSLTVLLWLAILALILLVVWLILKEG